MGFLMLFTHPLIDRWPLDLVGGVPHGNDSAQRGCASRNPETAAALPPVVDAAEPVLHFDGTGTSSAGLERNRGRDLERVSLVGRSTLEFTKILKPDVNLLFR